MTKTSQRNLGETVIEPENLETRTTGVNYEQEDLRNIKAVMEDKSKIQDSIVVAGISCRFPDVNNVNEFWDYLCKKGDKAKSKGAGGGFFAFLTGKSQSNDPTKFDASFFEMSPEEVNHMSPDLRTILELSYESIIDSGSHPQELKGSKIGVYVSSSSNGPTKPESHLQNASNDDKDTGKAERDLLVQKISNFFDFKGPKYSQDGGSSSPLLAIHQAIMDIKSGNSEGAVVGAQTHLRKSNDGDKDQLQNSIDSTDNSRTDAIVAVYITKQSLCKRAYAYLVNSGTNVTGINEGTTNFNGLTEQELIQHVCSGSDISVDDLEYLENHCSAPETDDQEISRIVKLFSQNRSTDKPLLYGSTTFEVAQNKVSSELASFIKAMLICNNDVIPPGHCLSPAALQTSTSLESSVKVAPEATKFNGGYIAINSSGPDGSEVLVITKPFCSSAEVVQSEMPKLVICSGRNMAGLRESIKYASNNKDEGFFYTLSNQVASDPVRGMPYRGYQLNRTREIKNIENVNDRPIWYIFAGVGSQWPGLAKDMMNLPRFRESILRSHETLDKVDPDFNLLNLLLDTGKDTFNSVIKTFVGIACVQVALINCLNDLGVTPDGYFGHSVGEVACAYVDGALTEEQAVLVAYWRGRSIVDPGKIYGAMASVGMSWDEAAPRLPSGVVLGCNNSAENVTISGDQEPVHKCMTELDDEGFYVSEIDTSGAAYHSHQIAEIAPIMTKALDDLNLTRTLRSPAWISTSYPEKSWDTEEAKWCDSKYLTNNLVSPVLFHEAACKIPPNAITIEIAPHCLMQSTLKRSLYADCAILSLMNRKEKDNLHYFFTNVGKLYTAGVNVNLNKLYPPVMYPVGVGTPSLSPVVEWDHSKKWNETSN